MDIHTEIVVYESKLLMKGCGLRGQEAFSVRREFCGKKGQLISLSQSGNEATTCFQRSFEPQAYAWWCVLLTEAGIANVSHADLLGFPSIASVSPSRGETRGRKARTNLDILDAGVGFQGPLYSSAMCAQLWEMEHFLLEQISEVPSRSNGGH